MNVKHKKERIFGACIVLLMAVLAVCTLTLAAVKRESVNSSYTLVIEKLFAEGIPQNVLDKAKEQNYTFRITGRTREVGSNTWDAYPEKTITLNKENNWTSETIVFGKPYEVMVTEVTDNITLEVGDKYYNMSNSTCDATITTQKRKFDDLNLKNNSILTIRRPAEKSEGTEEGNENTEEGNKGTEEIWYHVTNREEEGHSSSNFEKLDTTFPLKAGQEEKLTNLCAGIYTIEQIVAPDGYQLQLGERIETVGAGKEGHFHINGTPGRLTLTAGGTKGDGDTHYYTVDRTENDYENFEKRIVNIASGEDYVLDNLPKGGYTVTEYSYKGGETYRIKLPQTTQGKEFTTTHTNITETEDFTGNWVNYNKKTDATYWKLKIGQVKGPEKGTPFKVAISGKWYGMDDKILEKEFFNPTPDKNNNYKVGYTTTVNDPSCFLVPPEFQLKVIEPSNITGFVLTRISFIQKEVPKNIPKAGTRYINLAVDDRGWMEIYAPEVTGDPTGSEKVVYYYKVQNANNELVIDSLGRTDKADTTIMLKAGEIKKITGLPAGNYKITEIIEGDSPVGFTMKVEGMPFGTTNNEESIDVQVGGARNLIISKPAPDNPPAGATDNRKYKFTVTGSNNFNQEVEINVGEDGKGTITLPAEGRYKISPQKQQLEQYELQYTDSGAVYATVANATSSVKFTNYFNEGEYGYRFIHEYYIKKTDGTYEHVGNSQITTRLGRNKGEQYQALDITKEPIYQNNLYKHFDEAYGWVDGIPLEEEIATDLNHSTDRTYGRRLSTASSATKTNKDYGFSKTYSKKYATASSSSVQADPNHNSDETYSEFYFTASPSRARTNSNDKAPKVLAEAGITTDDKGIISKGTGKNSSDESLNYAPEAGEDHIKVTKEANRIIILRYYRDEQPKGKYNVIHVYYLRDEKGDHWEGVSKIESRDGQLDFKYNGKDHVKKQYDFQPKENGPTYTYNWDKRPQYGVIEESSNTDGEYNPNPDPNLGKPEFSGEGKVYRPNNSWTTVEATEEGNQIIILRYYREKGYYNIVHEYYFREQAEIQDNKEETLEQEKITYLLSGKPGTYKNEEEDSGTFTGTINRDDGYVYTFVGRTEMEPITALLGSVHTAQQEDHKPKYGEQDYKYIDEGYGSKSDDGSYTCNPDQQEAISTPEGDEVIILRYYREESKEPEPTPKVSYKYVHEYYFKHPNGTRTLDGKSKISEVTDAGADPEYTYKNVTQEPLYNQESYTYYDYGYGIMSSDTEYKENSQMAFVKATASGEQIIILRYEREKESEEPDPTPEVSYNYVHEYYLKHPDGSLTLEGKSDIGTVPNADADKEYTGKDVSRIPDYKGTTYTYYECGYGNVSDGSYKEDEGKKFVKATESGDQIIILRYYREESTKGPDPSPKVSYKYIHEYYFKHSDGSLTLEGKSDIGTVPDAKAGVEYNDKNVTQVPDYEGKTYTYFNCGYGAMFSDKDYSELPDKTFIYATESGEQIIILRYEREEKPEDPKPSSGGGRKHSDPDPKPTPAPTTVPEPVPEVPTVPVVESVPETSPVPEPDTPVLPDPNLPGSPERITIMDGGVPKTYVKVWNPTTEEYVYLEEDDVPLTGLNDPSLPRTSDNTNFFLWISLVSASLGGIIIIGYRRFLREH